MTHDVSYKALYMFWVIAPLGGSSMHAQCSRAFTVQPPLAAAAAAAVQVHLDARSPAFDMLTVEDLLPDDALDKYY
jgi:hypothetical protein